MLLYNHQKIPTCMNNIILLLLDLFLKHFHILASCQAIDLENGGVHYDRYAVDGRYPEDTLALLQCNIGYSVVGPSIKTCQSSNNWNKQEAVCKGKKCSPFTIYHFQNIDSII